MHNISRIIGENKRIVIAVFAALTVFAVFSVWQYSIHHQPGEADPADPSHQTEQEKDSSLTQEQKDIQDAYDNDTMELISFLKGSTFADGSSSSVSFSDDEITIKDSSSDQKSIVPYVITAVAEDEQNTSESLVTTKSIALLTSGEKAGSYILTLKETQTGEYGVDYKVSCSLFPSSDDYIRSDTSSEVRIEGVTYGFDEYINGSSSEMESLLRDTCFNMYPTATTATWTEVFTIDWSNSTLTTDFVLDDSKKSEISLTYDLVAGSWHVS